MSTWIRKPETVRLTVAGGEWVEVRKYLTAGDTRRMYWRMMRRGAGGDEKIDPLLVSVAKVAAYAIDWSATDADDRRIDITGPEAEATILAVCEMMDPDRFRELAAVIDAHETAVTEEKKLPPGVAPSVPIYSLPGNSVGATNG